MKLSWQMPKTARIIFEGKEVTHIEEIKDVRTKELTHCKLSVADEEKGAVLRIFTSDEMEELYNNETLRIDRNFYSPSRDLERLHDRDEEVVGQTKKQRDHIDLCMFLARRIEVAHAQGMPLTIDGVEAWNEALGKEYASYQAMRNYGTNRPNARQNLKPLPKPYTLLEYYRKYRRSGKSAHAFLPAKVTYFEDANPREYHDLTFVLMHLYDYVAKPGWSKQEVAENTRNEVKNENLRRTEEGRADLLDVKSVRTYERWIDKYLDPFAVVAAREGLAAAQAKFSTNETGLTASIPGERVEFDAWCLHVVSLATTRAEWLKMTEEQRAKVKRVRRWIVVAIDVATRCILGFALCRAPSQSASLEALRMCFVDKTELLREAGIRHGDWAFYGPIMTVVTDSGSEFGKNPFGGSRFSIAVRLLAGSLLNTVAGVPKLRAHIERLFRTFDLKWARDQFGYTASNPQNLGDRKPHAEACMTDDELNLQMLWFMHEYHNSQHAGIGGFTPAGMWEKLSKDRSFDRSQLPGPSSLREACGQYANVRISEDGIRFEGIRYSNKTLREERFKPLVDRFGAPGGQIEILYDPMNLGVVSIVTPDELIPVKAVTEGMTGKSLSDWRAERDGHRLETRQDADERAPARFEARDKRRGASETIALSAGVKGSRPTFQEISRAAFEATMGKGHNEKPFIGRDEAADPLFGGFSINSEGSDHIVEPEPEVPEETVVEVDQPSAMDRFRKSVRPLNPNPTKE